MGDRYYPKLFLKYNANTFKGKNMSKYIVWHYGLQNSIIFRVNVKSILNIYQSLSATQKTDGFENFLDLVYFAYLLNNANTFKEKKDEQIY